jgi:hypothetical protein
MKPKRPVKYSLQVVNQQFTSWNLFKMEVNSLQLLLTVYQLQVKGLQLEVSSLQVEGLLFTSWTFTVYKLYVHSLQVVGS